ncbi:YlcI/YnfO family protein [Erwinia aphidicola]|uniref:YlcI/YnfO family protein n=1 Tax=Erwinia aphidicola TaxID=68334 RepID=UPI0016541CA6|nr:YlcI/YnfO family protein [Erwinia persicina]MBD8167485.1 DUF3950 domain-containing protein [Erwinia persicina]
MATGNKNNRSQLKNIRFPHELLEKIDLVVEMERLDDPSVNFSSWVLDACGRKLKSVQRKQAKGIEE